MEELLDLKLVASVVGGIGVAFIMWVRKRLSAGEILFVFKSKSNHQLEEEMRTLEDSFSKKEEEVLTLTLKIENLEEQLATERSSTEQWQARYIEHLEKLKNEQKTQQFAWSSHNKE